MPELCTTCRRLRLIFRSAVRVCRTTWRTDKNRGLWIALQERMRQDQPVCCPRHTDLLQLNLPALKHLAFHVVWLLKLWDHYPSQSLRCGPNQPQSIPFGKKTEFVSLVPGGRYLFVHHPRAKTASCWDLESVHAASIVASIPIGPMFFVLPNHMRRTACSKLLFSLRHGALIQQGKLDFPPTRRI
jgi:hypothetical protein